MFRAYTVRCAPGTGLDPLWMWEAFNRNFVLHIACMISFTLTLAVVFTPVVNSAFHLTPIPFIAVVYATSFALLNMVLDELVPKPIYKRKIRRTFKPHDSDTFWNKSADDHNDDCDFKSKRNHDGLIRDFKEFVKGCFGLTHY